MPTLIMKAVPVSETGAAIGLNTLMRSLGTSLRRLSSLGCWLAPLMISAEHSYPASAASTQP